MSHSIFAVRLSEPQWAIVSDLPILIAPGRKGVIRSLSYSRLSRVDNNGMGYRLANVTLESGQHLEKLLVGERVVYTRNQIFQWQDIVEITERQLDTKNDFYLTKEDMIEGESDIVCWHMDRFGPPLPWLTLAGKCSVDLEQYPELGPVSGMRDVTLEEDGFHLWTSDALGEWRRAIVRPQTIELWTRLLGERAVLGEVCLGNIVDLVKVGPGVARSLYLRVLGRSGSRLPNTLGTGDASIIVGGLATVKGRAMEKEMAGASGLITVVGEQTFADVFGKIFMGLL